MPGHFDQKQYQTVIAQASEGWRARLDSCPVAASAARDQGFLDVGAKVFGALRFMEMYGRWLKRGNAAFEGPSSPVLAEALDTGAGRVESFVLPHSYRHLSPVVDRPRSRIDDVEERVVSMAAFAYAGVMYATAVVGGEVVRFKLSPALARAHRQNRGKAMTEAEAVAFVETKRRARALRRARPYLASRP